MNDNDLFPSFFYSRSPINEHVSVINMKNGDKETLYWKLSLEGDFKESGDSLQKHDSLAPYNDNEGEMLDCCDLEDNYEINPTKSGKFLTSFYVPSTLHAVIIGSRGSRLRQLQESTNTLIKVPRPNEEGFVKITGNTERSVASARTQITLLLLKKRDTLPVTHFVSVPVNTPSIKANFEKFKKEILNDTGTRGIDETIFQRAEKLHLTVVTMAPFDEKELEEAKAAFTTIQSVVAKRMEGTKPTIIVKGVEIMNDDPSAVDVLYGRVEDTTDGKLQQMMDLILELFSKTGSIKRQYDKVKLHVTLMNSRYRKTDKGPSKRQSFDASHILNKYKNYEFGQLVLDKIHLSNRFASAQDGYYQPLAIMLL